MAQSQSATKDRMRYPGWLMASPPSIPVSKPTARHFFSMAPRVTSGEDGSLVLSRSMGNRLILLAFVLIVPVIAALLIDGGLKTGEWWRVALLAPLLIAVWMVWSVVSVTFDQTQGLMRLRRSLYPLRGVCNRSLGDLQAVLVVKFKGMPFGHVRLIFGQSIPQTVELAAFWQSARAWRFATQLSSFLGVPLSETIYPPKRGVRKPPTTSET